MPDKKKWKIVEVVVRGNAAVIVSRLDLKRPRFSFRVGTAKFLEEGGSPHVTPWLNMHNILQGAELLTELEEKYNTDRSEDDYLEPTQDGPLITFKED